VLYEFNFSCVQFGLNVFFWERAAAESIICWLYKFPFSWNYLSVSRPRNLFSLKTSLGSVAGFSFCIQCYLGTAVVLCLRQLPCGKQDVRTNLCCILRATRILYLWALQEASMHLTGLPANFFFFFYSYEVYLVRSYPSRLRTCIFATQDWFSFPISFELTEKNRRNDESFQSRSAQKESE